MQSFEDRSRIQHDKCNKLIHIFSEAVFRIERAATVDALIRFVFGSGINLQRPSTRTLLSKCGS